MATTILTAALPYANGPLHIGHFVEYVLCDVHVRYLRSSGETVQFVCADDTHGAPIELNALKEGVSPETFVAKWELAHRADFATFDIQFDHFGSTNSSANKRFVELVYERLKAAGSIVRKEIEQPYDGKAQRWLSDRFIRGSCPNCGTSDQYGDSCEQCNATYSPRELRDARSALSGEPLTWRKSSHLFFALSQYEEELRTLLAKPEFTHPTPAGQLRGFFASGLADWDITRDGPYFGFLIPGETDKYFYVWLDAPIGYIAATEELSARTGGPGALALWDASAPTRVIHVIGKDIVYFHCLFWPAVLRVAGLKIPDRIQVHGHLTVNGAKMSKSRGSLIEAKHFGDTVDPSALRFYFASILGSGPDDLDLSPDEFRDRVNAGLVNNLLNLVNRTLSLLERAPLNRKLAEPDPGLGKSLVEGALARSGEIAAAYGSFDLRGAIRSILEVGAEANRFLTLHEPWKRMKSDPEMARRVLSEVCEVVYLLCTYLQPVVPRVVARIEAQLARSAPRFADLPGLRYPILARDQPIGNAKPLMPRLEAATVQKLFAGTATQPDAEGAIDSTDPTIAFADFARIGLVVGIVREVTSAVGEPPVLTIDLGGSRAQRVVVDSEIAVGTSVVVATNVLAQKGALPGRVLMSRPTGDLAHPVSAGMSEPGDGVH